MKSKLTIDVDNVAFENNPELELINILSTIKRKLQLFQIDFAFNTPVGVKDVNGNTVGSISITGKPCKKK